MTLLTIDADPNTPQPMEMNYIERPTVGRTLAGLPILQGYEGLECRWQNLTRTALAYLLSMYDPAAPAVTITFLDPSTGADTTRTAVWEWPGRGGPTYAHWRDVTIQFTHLEVP